MSKSLLRIGSLLCIVVAVGAVVWVIQYEKKSDIPIPFLQEGSVDLRGRVTPIGRKRSIVVERVEFPQGTTTETLVSSRIYLVSIPDDPLVPSVPLAQVVRVIGHGNPVVNYFGYKYTSVDAADEKAHRDDADFLSRFPGKFFASQTAWDEDIANGGTLAAFVARTGVTFMETGTSGGVQLERNSLYVIVENEPTREVAFTIRPLPVCGDSVQMLPLEQCDDGNTTAGDGCDSSCQVEHGWYCQEETPSAQANAAPAKPANSNRIADTLKTVFAGHTLTAEASGICGDGSLDPAEDCDDGNQINGDGCSSYCRREADSEVTITGPQVWDGNITSLNLVPRHWQYSVTLRNNGPETLKFLEVRSGPLPVPSLLNAVVDAPECEKDAATNELIIPLRCWFNGPFSPGWSKTFTVSLDTQLDVTNPQPPAIDFTMEIGNFGGVGAEEWIVTQLSDPVLSNNTAHALCGNGALDSGELCDAGTLNTPSVTPVLPPRPWCLDNCTLNLTSCGNNKVDTWEYCDDGGLIDGDGCSANCTVESGWTCTGDPSVCTRQNTSEPATMTWTAVSDMKFDTGLDTITSIAYGAGKFVAVSNHGKGTFSTDGITWTAIGDMKFNGLEITAVAFGADKFIAVNNYGKGAFSTDGITWTVIENTTFVEGRDAINSVTYGAGKFVMAGVNTGDIYHYSGKGAYSTDGITWTAIDDMKFSDSTINAVTYGGGKFVAAGDFGKGAYSTDGITWTAIGDMKFGDSAITSVAYGNGKFVAVGWLQGVSSQEAKGAYSTDGITWTGMTIGNITFNGGSLTSVAYGNGKFVAVGMAGKGAYSTDGITWTVIGDMKFSDRPISAVTYGADKFVAVGWDAKGAYSETSALSSSSARFSSTSSVASSAASSQSTNLGRSICHTLCGDGLTANTEQCDDGKKCSDLTVCTADSECAGQGDGLCQPRNGDGCSADCRIESGWTCTTNNPSVCTRQ